MSGADIHGTWRTVEVVAGAGGLFLKGNFVCYLTDDFPRNSVHYSICTLPEPYVATDPTVCKLKMHNKSMLDFR